MAKKRELTWREHAAPIIEKTLKETQGLPEKEIKKALRDAYPYCERENHPYKIWLDEIKRQRGLKSKVKKAEIDVVTLNLF